MSDASNSRPNGPPHRPRLRGRVTVNRKAQPVSREDQIKGFRGWHERGYLPHRDAPGLIQFVTFRLADSFPAERRDEWQRLLVIEDQAARRLQLEAYLDLGFGACHLRNPRIAELTANAFKHFDGQRYRLIAWCVMPNHVHVLFETTTRPMSEVIESWKRFIATNANKLLGQKGSFWQEDYWDTYMRDADDEAATVFYIEDNPTKAGMANWPWRSATKIPF
jgi:REP element-mobilizing transposase RayT